MDSVLRFACIASVLVVAAPPSRSIVMFVGTVSPVEVGWERTAFCEPSRWLDQGWLCQHVTSCCPYPPPGGQTDKCQVWLADFVGVETFFIEWRMQTDGEDSEIEGVAPASLVAGGVPNPNGVSYHFTIARDTVRLIRGNFNPIIYATISPGDPHTHRLELYGDTQYVWSIDGRIVDAGAPDGPFPAGATHVISWRAKSWYLESTTQWDFIRYGVIPQLHSGDFDSNGADDADDLYFFVACLLGPDSAGPGCTWAGMNGDGTVDGADIPLFVDLLTGG